MVEVYNGSVADLRKRRLPAISGHSSSSLHWLADAVTGFDVEFYKRLLSSSQHKNNLLFNKYYYTAHSYP
jgi:hypothetical protein